LLAFKKSYYSITSPLAFGENVEKVFLVKTEARAKMIQRLFSQFDMASFKSKKTVIKANYNSADPFPASTHIETLDVIVKELQAAGVKKVSVIERSGMGVTRNVLDDIGVLKLSVKLGFDVIVLDELNDDGWFRFEPPCHIHWQRSFALPKALKEADKIVQTCCLKTHRFGGHFSLSLKNSVGVLAQYVPGEGYNYMGELHSSSHQRGMIAEVNLAYKPDLVLMDGIKGFVRGGPEDGDAVRPNVILAGQDRVAIDAVGVAILRHFGTTREVSEGRIFEQQQLARAAELGIGVNSANDIELVPLDTESRKFAQDIGTILKNEG
jgi:uncharacterized protein (DUF362 family)